MTKNPTIEARVACFVADNLRQRGAPLDELLREVGLQRQHLASPDVRIPYYPTLRLIERAAAVTGDPSYALRLGAAHEARERGLIGFVALNSPTLFDALSNLKRYRKVVAANSDVDLEHLSGMLTLRFRERNPTLRTLRHHDDYLVGSLIRVCRDITRTHVVPVRVEFCHPMPDTDVAYAEILGCPIRFKCDWNAVVFSEASARLAVDAADDMLLRVLQQSCERIIGATSAKPDIMQQVDQLIVDGLPKGTAALEEVASKLGMSSKTLARRLAGRGQTFSALLDEKRRKTATHYLEDSQLRIFQIAYMAGYTDSAALVRAFKRWTGTTPQQFRDNMRATPA